MFFPEVGCDIILVNLLELSLSKFVLFTCIYTINLRKGKGPIALSTSPDLHLENKNIEARDFCYPGY